MILLAEHDEPSLAAKKKQRHVALETATSTPKNRVWNFFDSPLGRPGVDPDLSWETATGSVQYSYKNASGQGYYYTFDHLGSVRELCDGSGNIKTRYNYDVYGRATPTYVSGTHDATMQYAGYYFHPTSGLNLTLYRAYDPTMGRWLSRDPMGEDGGLNLYGFVGDDPVNEIDPLGLAGNIPLGGGYTARVDSFNMRGSSSYEIHVYGPNGNEIGVVNSNGLIPKHGIKSLPNLPPDVAKALQTLNQNQFWKRGVSGPVKGFSALTDLIMMYQMWEFFCQEQKAVNDMKKNHPEQYQQMINDLKNAD